MKCQRIFKMTCLILYTVIYLPLCTVIYIYSIYRQQQLQKITNLSPFFFDACCHTLYICYVFKDLTNFLLLPLATLPTCCLLHASYLAVLPVSTVHGVTHTSRHISSWLIQHNYSPLPGHAPRQLPRPVLSLSPALLTD